VAPYRAHVGIFGRAKGRNDGACAGPPTLRLCSDGEKFEAVGLHYRRDACDRAFRSLHDGSRWSADTSVNLVRQEMPEHDNAIQVQLAGQLIGYVPRDVADRYASALDRAVAVGWQAFQLPAYIKRQPTDNEQRKEYGSAFFHVTLFAAHSADALVPLNGQPDESVPSWFPFPRYRMPLVPTDTGRGWARSLGMTDRGEQLGAWAMLQRDGDSLRVDVPGVGTVGTQEGASTEPVRGWLTEDLRSGGTCWVPLNIKLLAKGPSLTAYTGEETPDWVTDKVRVR
jgi:hypothetical protein